jgi:tetratricopeptide (TPR) repeat protein
VGAQAPPSWLRRDWLLGLILILFVVAVYTPVWKAGFLLWDDNVILTSNPCIVGPLGLKEIWTTSAADICPLTLTTFWVEHALWALNPLPYHLVNVLLHGLSALLLWRVLRSLRVQGAWLGAALWGLHPVVVESVAWVAEMKNTESGLFFLLSILFFVRWLTTKDLAERTGTGWNYALSLLFAAVAMAAKSSTVILPVVLCLCAWWIEGRWHWRNLVRTAPLVPMAIAVGALSIWTHGLQLAKGSDPQLAQTWPERLGTAGEAVWFYLGKLLWPHPLIAIYPRWQTDAGLWVSYLPLLAAIVILAIFSLRGRSGSAGSRACFFAFAYFVVGLLPILGLIDNYIFRFDHFQYLASIGPLALTGTALVRLSDVIIPKKPLLQSALCAGLLLIVGMASWQRARVFKTEDALWTDTLAKDPDSWAAHINLGDAFILKGQVDDAVAQYQRALQINPDYPEALTNLGVALFRKGRVDDAVAQYQKALSIKPNFMQAHNDLGLALVQRGQVDDAVTHYQKALEINPNSAEIHTNLGNALFRKGQVDNAVAHYQKALEINPNYAETHDKLGNALLRKGQVDDAVAHYQKALEISPYDPETHYNLAKAFVQKGQLGAAITQFQEVLRLKPDFSAAQDDLDNVEALVRQLQGHK